MANFEKVQPTDSPLSGTLASKESLADPEKMLPQPECVAVLGRGIELASGQWKPSRYIQDVDPKPEGRFVRTGKRKPLREPENEQTLATGGGTANTNAAIQFFEEMKQHDFKPQLLILAAGRPAYLDNEPADLSEGSVMQDILKRRVENLPETIIFKENRNTRDDIINSLTTAHERGLHSVVFINTEINMLRAQDFYKDVIRTAPELQHIAVSFITSEDLLLRRYAQNPHRRKEILQILASMRTGDPRARTEWLEEIGRRKIGDQTYGQGGTT